MLGGDTAWQTLSTRLVDALRIFFGFDQRVSPPSLPPTGEHSALSDVQRRISIYLHALWGCDFTLGETQSQRAFIQDHAVRLPAYFYDFAAHDGTCVTALETYRAAAAHAAAHLIYSQGDWTTEPLTPVQKAMVAVIEDARVEALAIRRFPGLQHLWSRHHHSTPLQHTSTGDYLNRLARALLDENYRDDDAWISQARTQFLAAEIENYKISLALGLSLAESFAQKKIRFNARSDTLHANYRDDNRHLWALRKLHLAEEQELPSYFLSFKLLLTSEKVLGADEAANLPPAQIAIEHASVAATFLYPEWDYRGQIETPSWVTLRERTPPPGEMQIVTGIVAQNRHLITRMKNLLMAIKYRGVRRIRKLEQGDEIDINAAIRALMDMRLGMPPDTRIMMRSIRKTRDISVLLLLDLSYSTNQKIRGQNHTVLELTRQVCILFADAIDTVADPFAIHGFNSRGRHDVDYFRFKDFDQPYDDIPKAKIAGMVGDRSTRMGAAIRHATHFLNQQKSHKKLLMIITDGAPSDIDMPDHQYLRQDAKHAVNEAARNGVHSYCIGLDPDADQYIARIFGARHYMVVDHVKHLPEKMLQIYAALTL